MKGILLIIALFFACQAIASVNLECTTTDPDFSTWEGDKVIILDVLQSEGNMSVEMDGGVMEQPIIGETIEFGVSNECENDYGFKIKTQDVRDLAAGLVSSIQVQSEYYNGNSEYDEEANTYVWKQAVLTCRLKTL